MYLLALNNLDMTNVSPFGVYSLDSGEDLRGVAMPNVRARTGFARRGDGVAVG
jgi:hypothetical protein